MLKVVVASSSLNTGNGSVSSESTFGHQLQTQAEECLEGFFFAS